MPTRSKALCIAQPVGTTDWLPVAQVPVGYVFLIKQIVLQVPSGPAPAIALRSGENGLAQFYRRQSHTPDETTRVECWIVIPPATTIYARSPNNVAGISVSLHGAQLDAPAV